MSNTCDLSKAAIEYKKKLSKSFISLNPEKLNEYFYGETFHVTRKYDGQFTVLFFEGDAVLAFNSSGKEFPPLPCITEAAACLKEAKVQKAVLAAELYADESGGRTRVFHSLSALADPGKHGTLRLAFFDILSIDGEEWDAYQKGGDYGNTHKKLSGIFKSGMCAPVKYCAVKSKDEVRKIFDEWVTEGGSEGLVIYGKTQSAAKAKPTLNVDVAVIGFSEGDTPETIRTLLFALLTEDGGYQVLGRTGSGLNEDQKKELWKQLMPQTVKSNYVEVDSNHVAFHFVKPGLVMELNAIEVLIENSRGPMRDPVLSWQNNEWKHSGTAAGYSLLSPVIVRMRPDKTPDGAGIGQLSGYVFNPHTEADAAQGEDSPSTVLKREVYQKPGAKMMVQKFMAWKTNKKAAQFPEYVFSYTNFSSGRAAPLSIDVRISSSEEQIMKIYQDFVTKNVAKGWVPAS